MVALCGVTSKSLKFVKSVDFELKQVLMFTTTALPYLLKKKPLGNHTDYGHPMKA